MDDEAAERAHMSRIEEQVAAEHDANLNENPPTGRVRPRRAFGCRYGCDDGTGDGGGCDGACMESY